MDSKTQQEVDHRADQKNPNNKETGPGKEASYPGAGDKADLDNHAKQLNSNNTAGEEKKTAEDKS